MTQQQQPRGLPRPPLSTYRDAKQTTSCTWRVGEKKRDLWLSLLHGDNVFAVELEPDVALLHRRCMLPRVGASASHDLWAAARAGGGGRIGVEIRGRGGRGGDHGCGATNERRAADMVGARRGRAHRAVEAIADAHVRKGPLALSRAQLDDFSRQKSITTLTS